MTTDNYKNVEEWGVFIYACLIIAYFFLNILFHNNWTKDPLSNWIFVGPILIFPFAAFYISMRLVSGTELPDESDKAKIRERCAVSKAAVAGFAIWLIVLVILDQIQVEINLILSVLCGCALIIGIYRLLKIADRKETPE